MIRIHLQEGGEGSGNFGHEGRPGEVGGSTSGNSFPSGYAELLKGDFYQILLSAHGIKKSEIKTADKEKIKNALIQTYNTHAPFYKDKIEEFKNFFLETFSNERKLIHAGDESKTKTVKTLPQLRNHLKKIVGKVIDVSVKYEKTPDMSAGYKYAQGYTKNKTSVDVYVSLTKTGADASFRRIGGKGLEIAELFKQEGYEVDIAEPNYVHIKVQGDFKEK